MKTVRVQPVASRAGLARVLDRFIAPQEAVSDGAAPSATSADLVAYVARHLERLHVPGATLVLVEGDQTVYMRGFGRARPGGEVPSPQTPFLLGSTTKSFTALAVLQLAENGKIELDAPVQRYLPWFRVADPAASAAMTVRHLLNQTSGLPQWPGVRVLADLDQRPSARERQARALATLVLKRPAGAAFEYSNLNYNLLGLIIEAVSGASYEAYIQEHIFAPLDMPHSYATRTEAEQHGMAVGHRYWFAVPIAAPDMPVPRGSVSSGCLISSAEDMAHYLIAHLNDGRYGDGHILSPQGIDELHRPAVPVEIMGSPAGAYGMGWIVDDSGQRKVLWHDGVLPHFYSYMALVPEQKKGVALLVNANHMLLTFALREVGVGVGTLLAGQQPPPIRFGGIPWALRSLPLLPLLQLVGVVATARRVRRWRREPLSRPTWGPAGLRSLLLPLLPNLAIAIPLLLVRRTGTRRFLLLYMPDCTWIALLCGSGALAWLVVRTGLVLAALRAPQASRAAGG